MKKYVVEITDEALADMEQIYDYIASVLQVPENAIRQYNRIADAIVTLDVLAERVPVMRSESEHKRGLCRLLVDNYSIFYIIQKDKVIVMNVLYSATNIEERLED